MSPLRIFDKPVIPSSRPRSLISVTFIAILELLRESIIEVVQSEDYAPLHVRAASSVHLVADEGEQVETPPSE